MTTPQKKIIGALIIVIMVLLLIYASVAKKSTTVEYSAILDDENMSVGKKVVLIETDGVIKKEANSNDEPEDYSINSAYPEIKPPGGGFTVRYEANSEWRSEMARWNEDMLAPVKTGVNTVPQSRVASDSAEAVEYVRIARATIRSLLDKANEPTVDIFPTSVIVAFRIKRSDPPEGYLRAGRTNRYVVIDTETKAVISVGAW